jgi:uncharacterized membrane protein YfcA
MVVICSIPAIWHAICWRRVLPFVLGGLVGVPMGTLLLGLVSSQAFKSLIGCLLVVYCGFMLLRRSTPIVSWDGRMADGAVGLGGGILGGLACLSGPLPTVWASLRGWGKDEKRGIFQTFNLSILLFAAASHTFGGFMTTEIVRWMVIALPGTLSGAWMGRKTYDKLGDGRFNQIVLVLLLLSGISIIVTSSFVRWPS